MASDNPFAPPGVKTAESSIPKQSSPSGKVLLLPPAKETSVRVSAWDAVASLSKEKDFWPTIGMVVLAIFASSIIPIIPQIVMLGYIFYLVESKIRMPSLPIKPMSFDYLVKYLTRGAWAFLAQLALLLIISIPLALVGIVLFMAVGGISVAAGEDVGPIILVVLGGISVVFFVLFSIVCSLYMIPAAFRAGMSGSFSEAFNLGWINSFVSKVWKEALLSMVVFVLLVWGMVFVGLLACFVGVYVAAAWIQISQMLLVSQWYRLFLARGGEPIEMDPKLTLEEIAN